MVKYHERYRKRDTLMKDVPTVSAATGYTTYNEMSYILVFIETLYMKDIEHTLINPNQFQNF